MTELINHDAFLSDGVDIDSDKLLRFMVTSFAEISQRLVSEEVVDENFGPYVATVLRINEDGEPVDATLLANKRASNVKIHVTRLFPDCSNPHSRIWLRWGWDAFEFAPGSNFSNWVKASDLGMKIMKTNNKDDGLHESDVWEDMGVTDFVIRLVVTPVESVDEVEVRAVALPLPLEKLSTLPGGQAKSLPGFPVINLFKEAEKAYHVIPNMEPARGDGLPVLPILLHTLAEAPNPALDLVRESMYAVWRSCLAANYMSAQTWNQVVYGENLETDPIRSTYSWPAYVGNVAGDQNDGDTETETGE